MNTVELCFLVHCYFLEARLFSMPLDDLAVKDAIAYLINKELINENHRLTERGKVHVEKILALPLPTQIWS